MHRHAMASPSYCVNRESDVIQEVNHGKVMLIRDQTATAHCIQVFPSISCLRLGGEIIAVSEYQLKTGVDYPILFPTTLYHTAMSMENMLHAVGIKICLLIPSRLPDYL